MPVQVTIIHVLGLIHHVLANLVPRIRAIFQICGDKAHQLFAILIRLVRRIWVVVPHQLLVALEGVASQKFLELQKSSGGVPTSKKNSIELPVASPTGLELLTFLSWI